MLPGASGPWLATGVTSNPEPLRFRILGSLEAEVAEHPLELGGPKQQAVLGVLLLRAGQVVPDDRLIDEIWGESPPESAAHSLEAYVSKLRSTLGPHGVGIERRGGGYRLGLGSATLDSEAFATLVERAAQASDAREDADAAELARQALDLWRGPVLSGISLHAEGRSEAERLDELRWRALELRFEAELDLGHHAALVGELRGVVEESPFRESLVAQLMVALYRSGRQAEALEVYERVRRALDEDLGLRPSAELQRLAGQIVRQEPQLRLPTLPVETAADRRTKSTPRWHRLAILLVGALAVVDGRGAWAD